jgi:hypothetical protein
VLRRVWIRPGIARAVQSTWAVGYRLGFGQSRSSGGDGESRAPRPRVTGPHTHASCMAIRCFICLLAGHARLIPIQRAVNSAAVCAPPPGPGPGLEPQHPAPTEPHRRFGIVLFREGMLASLAVALASCARPLPTPPLTISSPNASRHISI